jgi:enterochelin esterase family protein
VALTTRGPLVSTNEVTFRFADPTRAVTAVALAHELRRPRRISFERAGRRGTWTLDFRPSDVDRMEYLLELTQRGHSRLVPDPANPLRAPGPFGEKSVVELPAYDPPAWVADDESPQGEVGALELPVRALHRRVDVLVWSPADADPAEPLPLLIAHDGPEYAEYSQLVRFLDHVVSFGEVPPLRAALVQPVDRNETYSASARYARAFAQELVPRLREALPTDGLAPVVMGASLGGLAALHAYWQHPGTIGGLFLQSSSFFRERWDKHESGFRRFGRIARFVGHVLAGRAAPPQIPVTITVGRGEENLDNNRAVAKALETQGWDARLAVGRDAHNWVAWRDLLDPHLPDLLLRAWT